MKFLKNLFKKKKTDIKLSEVKDFLSPYLTDINNEIENIKNNFSGNKDELNNSLIKLDKAELINPNILPREIHFMQGNKENFINKTNLFLKDLEFPKEFSELDSFIPDFEEKITEFNESTQKAFHILTNYFAHEMKAIGLVLNNIEKNNVKLHELMKNEKTVLYKTILFKLKEISQHITDEKNLKDELIEITEDINHITEKNNKDNDKLIKLKEGKEYGSYVKLDKQKDAINEEIKTLENKLDSKITIFKKGFKKLKYNDYLENSLDALKNDSDLTILNVIKELKDKIKNNKIELKDKQKERILKAKLEKTFLKQIVLDYNKLKENKSDILSKIDKSKIMMDFKELEYSINHNTEKQKRKEEELSEKNRILKHLNIENSLEKLESKISELSGYEVNIEL